MGSDNSKKPGSRSSGGYLSGEEREKMFGYGVVVLGEPLVGKTAIVQRLLDNSFSQFAIDDRLGFAPSMLVFYLYRAHKFCFFDSHRVHRMHQMIVDGIPYKLDISIPPAQERCVSEKLLSSSMSLCMCLII